MELPEEFESMVQEILADRQVYKKIQTKGREWSIQLRDGRPKVCFIHKAIFGLRQSGRQWHKKLDQEPRRIGLKLLQGDPCVYVMGAGEKMTIVAVYVGDILIATKDHRHMAKLKVYLSNVEYKRTRKHVISNKQSSLLFQSHIFQYMMWYSTFHYSSTPRQYN